ncbi:MAG: hypothetical protein IKW90_14575 [Lachnospiraceae bacterium]|nr:hypothetical protein [Lachnospiraceae bacterium]
MICVDIDELVPCLIDNLTGERVNTEVLRVRRKSFLAKFTKKNGWYTNWADLSSTCEVYALVTKGTVDIQGLVAVEDRPEYKGAYIAWAVAAPHNNPELTDFKKYNGVGGHLLAIAIERSEQLGYNGDVTGFCRSEEIMQHFINRFGAEEMRMLHEYQIGFFDEAARNIRKEYDYEWSDDEI